MEHKYDLLGHLVASTSIDTGSAWELPACDGQVVYYSDGGYIGRHSTYERLRRELNERTVQGQDAAKLVTQIEYGENVPDAAIHNLKKQPFRVQDEAGVQTNLGLDFDGNCTHTSRQFVREFKKTVDWTEAPDMEVDIYESRRTFNAFGRVIMERNAGSASSKYVYNRMNTADSVFRRPNNKADWVNFVQKSSFNANRKIRTIVYGNGARTTSVYDLSTERLVQKTTVWREEVGEESLRVI